jgi:glycosyltransferase involved in cell wall biosynthesis
VDWAVITPVPRAENPVPPAATLAGAQSTPALWRLASEETIRAASDAFRDVPFDIVHSCRLWTSAYVQPYLDVACRPLWHLDLDDIESETHHRIADRCRANRQAWMAAEEEAEAQRFATAQAEILSRCDRVYVCSQLDQKKLAASYGLKNVQVLPNAVRIPPPLTARPPTDTFTLLFVGILDYYPNEDAVLFFGNQILPRLRRFARGRFRVAVVGSGNVPSVLDRIASFAEVDLIGSVDRLEPWYQLADAVIVPLRAGGGTRIKILEAMSYRRPVVTTSIGIEGLAAREEEHLLVGDTAQSFAWQCMRLMGDPGLAKRLTTNAFDLCVRRYGIEAVGAALAEPASA